MDDRTKRAEELMEERLRARTNGETQSGDARAQVDDALAQLDQLTRDLQRERADFANYRRRNEAERTDFARFAKTELITRLLEVLDDFDRALTHVPAVPPGAQTEAHRPRGAQTETRSGEVEHLGRASGSPASEVGKGDEGEHPGAKRGVPPSERRTETQPWVEGMWLVERKLRDMLASEGLEEIGSVGRPFDPYIHEAIGHVDSDAPEGTVVDEVRKAYKLHDRVIRPALVTVASGTPVPPGAQTETHRPRGAQTEAPVPPGAQTEAPQRRGRAPGPEGGLGPTEGRKGGEVEHPGAQRGVPPSERRTEEES